MIKLSTDLVKNKNLVCDTGAWIILIEIRDKDDELFTDPDNPDSHYSIRICSNTDEIEWPTGSGTIWTPYPFALNSFGENSKNEVSTTTLQISNIDRLLNTFVESHKGFRRSVVTIRIVHSNALNSALVPEHKFRVKGVSVNAEWVVFSIGANAIFSKQDPQSNMHRTFCRYKRRLDDPLCGYTRENPDHTQTCDGTITKCRELNWSLRFGGFPGIPSSDVSYS